MITMLYVNEKPFEVLHISQDLPELAIENHNVGGDW